jgi:hypothetical protein
MIAHLLDAKCLRSLFLQSWLFILIPWLSFNFVCFFHKMMSLDTSEIKTFVDSLTYVHLGNAWQVKIVLIWCCHTPLYRSTDRHIMPTLILEILFAKCSLLPKNQISRSVPNHPDCSYSPNFNSVYGMKVILGTSINHR